jgi:hypothetical protein
MDRRPGQCEHDTTGTNGWLATASGVRHPPDAARHMTQCSEETTVDNRISSTEAEVPTGVATIVVTISHYRSGDTSVWCEPATYSSRDESVPSCQDAYVSPGPSEGGRSSIRRWRAPLAGASSHEPVTGHDDTNLVRPKRRRPRTLAAMRRRHGTALVVAAAAAIAAAVFMLSPASGSGALVAPTAPTSPEAEAAAMSTTKPADCSDLTASGWMGGLYGLYGSSAEALSALAANGQAGEWLSTCLPQATTCSSRPTSTEPGGPTSPRD